MGKMKEKFYYWAFLAPCLFALGTVIFLPMMYGVYYSFTNSNGINMDFIGIENYIALFNDSAFLDSVWFTIRFTVASVLLINIIGLSFALVVTQKMGKFSTFLRTVYFMPNLIGGIILGFVWQFIFLRAFEGIAESSGWGFFSGWLGDATTGFWGLVILFVWQMSGYIMVIYVSFLNSIPEELMEAASVDGANIWQQFWRIKFPSLAPAFTVSLFLTISNAFKVYDQNLALTNGGPFRSTEMVSMNIYNTAFVRYEQGYAQSKGVFFLVLVAAITAAQLYFTRKREIDL